MEEEKHYDILPTLPQQQLILLENLSEEAIQNILQDDSILFKISIPENTNTFHYTERVENEQMEYHRNFTYKEARKSTKRIEKKKWIKTLHRYKVKKKYSRKPIKNANIRLGWRFQNFFIVKAMFTFGIRKVPSGHIDLLQTTEAPILGYTPKKCVKNTIFQNINERTLPHLMERSFDCFILKPFHKYLVHSNQTYIVITVQKTFFSITRMDASIFNKIGLKKVKSIETYPFSEHKSMTKQQRPPPPVVPTKWDSQPLLEQQQNDNYFLMPQPPFSLLTEEQQQHILFPEQQQQQLFSPEAQQQHILFPEQQQQQLFSPEAQQQHILFPEQQQQQFFSPLTEEQQQLLSAVDVSPQQQSTLSVRGTEFKIQIESDQPIEIDPADIDLFFKEFFNKENAEINFEDDMFT